MELQTMLVEAKPERYYSDFRLTKTNSEVVFMSSTSCIWRIVLFSIWCYVWILTICWSRVIREKGSKVCCEVLQCAFYRWNALHPMNVSSPGRDILVMFDGLFCKIYDRLHRRMFSSQIVWSLSRVATFLISCVHFWKDTLVFVRRCPHGKDMIFQRTITEMFSWDVFS